MDICNVPGLNSIELLAKGFPWKSSNIPSICHDNRFSSTNKQQSFIAKDNIHTSH